jgi:uncharacterized protein YkwD
MLRNVLALAATILIGAGAAEAACSVPRNAEALNAEAMRLINAERSRRGLDRLASLGALQRAAEGHSCDMAQRNSATHLGSNGSTFEQRLVASGGCKPGAENVAYGYRSPSSVVAGWMASPPHRANILHSRVTHIGLAIAMPRSGNTVFWTMVVGREC